MDPLTHALSGALAVRAVARADAKPADTLRRISAGFLAAAAPDLDSVFAFLGPETYLLTHRGVTHSVLLLPLWALALSWLLAPLLRSPGGWRSLYGVCALGIGLHIAGDVITSFGTMVFAPLSDWRAGIGTTFIIDLWFTGILIAGLLACGLWRRSRWPATLACMLLVGYVGLQAVQRHRAIEVGEAYARTHSILPERITALPQPVSPFNWTVFVSDAHGHRFTHVNLRRTDVVMLPPNAGFLARLDAAYRPVALAQWQERSRYGDTAAAPLAVEAWQSSALAVYRWFADVPAFDGMSEGSTCVWFADLRFLMPGRQELPFRYGACREAPGQPWRGYQRVGEHGKLPLH